MSRITDHKCIWCMILSGGNCSVEMSVWGYGSALLAEEFTSESSL